jgi:hypothetical protein
MEAPLMSPQGHQLCRSCFHAGTQAAADNRAAQGGAFGALGGGLLYLGGQSGLDAGMRNDLDAKLLRSCAKCKAPAVTVVHVTFHYVNGITRGRTYLHRCGACQREFKTESVLRTIVELATSGACMLVGGGSIFFAEGWLWLLVLLLPLGGWLLFTTAKRIAARFTNPVVPRAAT